MQDERRMEGFEREDALMQIWANPDVRERLYMWRDFMAVARVLTPERCEHAFERRPCERTLRYIGFEEFDEPARSEEPDPEGMVRGNTYHSIDFNGATYTLRETGRLMGYAYFEVVEGDRALDSPPLDPV